MIQDKYGVNEEYNKGDNTYVLKDVQEKGTFYAAIWDAGGTDEIVYDGARNANIDLRPATLKYEEGGGGRVSYVTGINGGFTVANGVTIENIRSGSGNDVINANDVANIIIAGAGDDTVNGFGGDDAIYAGAGKDIVTGGAGKDTFLFAELGDSGVGIGRDVITDFVRGEDKIDLDQMGGRIFVGNAAFSGRAGEVSSQSGDGVTVVRVDVNGDKQADVEIELAGLLQLDISDFIDLLPANQRLVGTSGADNLVGGDGNDTLIGLAGNDRLDGGAGSDTADYSGLAESTRIDLDIAGAQVVGKTGGSDTLISIEN